MVPALLIALALATATPEVTQAQPDPKLVRVWITTDDSGHPEELAGRRESLKHLTAALAKQKKLLVLVDKEDAADLGVEVLERRVDVPRFTIGVVSRPGDPPGTVAPARTVKLMVQLTWKDENVPLTNKNKPLESQLGWSSAADDIAKQVEKWITERRQRILDGRHLAPLPIDPSGSPAGLLLFRFYRHLYL
jgi:hypothetical protein